MNFLRLLISAIVGAAISCVVTHWVVEADCRRRMVAAEADFAGRIRLAETARAKAESAIEAAHQLARFRTHGGSAVFRVHLFRDSRWMGMRPCRFHLSVKSMKHPDLHVVYPLNVGEKEGQTDFALNASPFVHRLNQGETLSFELIEDRKLTQEQGKALNAFIAKSGMFFCHNAKLYTLPILDGARFDRHSEEFWNSAANFVSEFSIGADRRRAGHLDYKVNLVEALDDRSANAMVMLDEARAAICEVKVLFPEGEGVSGSGKSS